MVDLSSIHSRHGYTKYYPGSNKIHHSDVYDVEDSLVCGYCNQVYKKGNCFKWFGYDLCYNGVNN